MKTVLLLFALLAFSISKAQETNCWVSADYYYSTSKPGYKKVKGEAWVCFNNHAVSLWTKETGVVTFTYMDTWSGIDSSVMQPSWQGSSGDPSNWTWGEYIIDMTYNNKIKIQHTKNGVWSVQLNNIKHSTHGPRQFAPAKKGSN